MRNPKWKFRIPQESEVNQDPIEGEFFTTQDVGDFADALVRESIQNSLDAKLPDGDGVVTVRFCFSRTTDADNIGIHERAFFEGLRDHIDSPDNGLNKSEIPDFNKPIRFLAVEDFQTVGLDGDVRENDDPKSVSPLGHNFYWFWRNVGRSGKKGSERGKWGLGKTVFPASSTINTFFALTNRYDDSRNLLMGLAVLKTHHVVSEPHIKRYPYGYFGIFAGEDEYFATPVEDEPTIGRFRDTFKLIRNKQTSSGLSVVIPFPRKEITSAAIVGSVLRQYFHPIISGNLIVEVVDENRDLNVCITDKSISNLLDVAQFPPENSINAAQLRKLFELCVWAIRLPDNEYLKLNAPSIHNSPMWRKEWYLDEAIKTELPTILDKFDRGQRIGVAVPVKVHEVGGVAEICWFKVFLEKDKDLQEPIVNFVRDGITITGIRKPKYRFIRSIVVIEDKKLVKLLGLAENPAHTEWQKDSSHFRGRYVDGDKVISFIEKSIDNLCSWLVKPVEGIDKELMKDVFYVRLPEENDLSEDSADYAGNESTPQDVDLASKGKAPFIIEKTAGGFRIRRKPKSPAFKGTIRVETAYMVVKGSPLRRYSPYDFDLSAPPIVVRGEHVSNLKYNQNQVTFDCDDAQDFVVDIRGFDEKRDLFIKAHHYDSQV